MEFYEKNYSPEQKAAAKEIVALEKAALDKWFKGDSSGYLALWSREDFSYFDGAFERRVDTYDEIETFVKSVVDGKLYADSYDFRSPRVQFCADAAILTYQLFAATTLIDMRYNCVQVYRKQNGVWSVVHSTWSFIRPMDMDFGKFREIV